MSRLLDDDVIHLTIQYRTSSTTCLFDFCADLKMRWIRLVFVRSAAYTMLQKFEITSLKMFACTTLNENGFQNTLLTGMHHHHDVLILF